MHHLNVIYASTSGNTQYVVETLQRAFERRSAPVRVTMKRAELASPADLHEGDTLLLCSGTWNTGGREGQLHAAMHELLFTKAEGASLAGKPVTFISLGDSRYYFTTRCTEHFLRFQRQSGAKLALPPLILVNEPYGQEARVEAWADKFLKAAGIAVAA